jgi:1A family penicillin-binding protein
MQKKHHSKKFFLNIALIVVGIGLFIAGGIFIWLTTVKIPDFSSFENRSILRSTKIYDRTGKVLLYDLHQDIKRTEVSLTEMNPYVQKATIAIEDSEFYKHKGIRITSIIRAVFANLVQGDFSQGGSTLTQQIVKNTLLTKEKTVTRKIKEWIIALKIERQMSKEKILEIYLNDAPYGGNIYGVEEASQSYFGKKASDLTLAEAAYLAAIPQAPTYYSPFGNHRDKLDERKNLVLRRMNDLKLITTDEYNQARAEVVTWKKAETRGIKAPHFVFFIKEYLENTYGKDTVEQGGLKVITTLNYDMQQEGEEITKRLALENETKYKASNAGLVALDPKTGQILTMVGSRDYFDKNIDGAYNIATANRQPGSAFKPIVYALGFEKGYRPDTILFDLPTEFNTGCSASGATLGGTPQSTCYMPSNYSGTFSGPLMIKKALGGSINVPAVKMLYLVGVNNAITLAREMGITTLTDPDRYGLSLVLGGGEVKLLEMTSAFGTFATEGIHKPYTGILKIEDNQGQVLEEYKDKEGTQVLSTKTADWISDILSDNTNRAWVFGANNKLYFPERQVAAKTGTTSNFRDAWIIGYTPSLVVGAWAGNNDNTPMASQTSSIIAAPIWNEFFRKQFARYPAEYFNKAPEEDLLSIKPILRGNFHGGDSYIVDKTTGQPATDNTPPENKIESVITNVHDILYWVDKSNPRGPKPTNPYNDPQFRNWETAVRNWWIGQGGAYQAPLVGGDTQQQTQTQNNTTPIVFSITKPQINQSFDSNQPMTIEIQTQTPLKKWDILLNGVYVGSQNNGTQYVFNPSQSTLLRSNSTISVIGYDSANNTKEMSVPITFSN